MAPSIFLQISIKHIQGYGRDFVQEAKIPRVRMPFDKYTQEEFLSAIMNDYENFGISASRVWLQSFQEEDVLYWLQREPEYAKQAILLDEHMKTVEGYRVAVESLPAIAASGITTVASPIFALVTLGAAGKFVPSLHAIAAKKVGLDIIIWSFERSGPLNNGGGYYFQSVSDAPRRNRDVYQVVDVIPRMGRQRGCSQTGQQPRYTTLTVWDLTEWYKAILFGCRVSG